jgi:hypothetical protein
MLYRPEKDPLRVKKSIVPDTNRQEREIIDRDVLNIESTSTINEKISKLSIEIKELLDKDENKESLALDVANEELRVWQTLKSVQEKLNDSDGWRPQKEEGMMVFYDPAIISEDLRNLRKEEPFYESKRGRVTDLRLEVGLGRDNGIIFYEEESGENDYVKHSGLLYKQTITHNLTQAEIAFWLATQEPHLTLHNERIVISHLKDKVLERARASFQEKSKE